MSELDRLYKEVESAFSAYSLAYERQVAFERLTKIYDSWNRAYQDHWSPFSMAYKSLSEFYMGDNLPVEVVLLLVVHLHHVEPVD